MGKVKNYYQELSELPIKRLVEKKGGLDYLSWSNAWDMLKKIYPTAQRNIYEDITTNLNYFSDGKTAYVKVGVLVNDIEHIDYLPVMDFRNKSISVDKITSMDVNKAIQRATAKAIAMHGLGLSLWTGEDIPSEESSSIPDGEYTIEVGDEKWTQVLKYVAANKELGLKEILKRLSTKYKFTINAKKEIEKVAK